MFNKLYLSNTEGVNVVFVACFATKVPDTCSVIFCRNLAFGKVYETVWPSEKGMPGADCIYCLVANES
jgi:hypothetical protein